jgi:molecular chaperone GrpE
MKDKEIEKLKQDCQDYLAGWQRAKADLVNYKREEGERLKGWITSLKIEWIKDLLPVLDSIDRAGREIPEDKKKDEMMRGLLQIGELVRGFFKDQGVREIETSGMFNSALHEAVQEVEDQQKKSGEIVEVVEKGYLIEGKVVRAAKVILVA